MLLPRILTVIIGLPLVLAAILVDARLFAALVAIVVALGLWEFAGISRAAGGGAFRAVSMAAGVVLVAAAWAGIDLVPVLFAALVAVTTAALTRYGAGQPLLEWATSLAGIAYIAVPAAFFVMLRGGPEGASWVLIAVLGTFGADTGAYLVGRLIGRHPMAPRISPKKTWEGFAGGVLGAMLVTGLLSQLLGMPYSVLFGYLLGVPITVMGQLGDVGESLLKRSAGAKDAGSLLPGHGGILDRLDSLLFVGPVIYLVSLWIHG